MKPARIILHVAFCILILAGFAGTAAAATSNKTNKSSTSTSSSSSTQGGSSATGIQTYTSTSPLQIGTIVQLVGKTTDSVSPATQANMQEMYGTVVDPNILPLTVTDNNLTNETYVATGGQYNVLVDTENGAIKEGDYVTISAVDGVAMKAGTYDQQKMVFGRAAATFDGKANVIATTTLKDTNGQTDETVQLGIIPVSIDIQRNPDELSTKVDLPPFLQQLGQAIAQKPIGPTRIYLSIIITGLCIMVALVTLYSGIRNAMIAIGRNPLSKKSIFRGLLEVILTGFLILIIGLFAVYLLLKL
jgi:hypothetical protein